MHKIKLLLQEWLPPVLVRILKRINRARFFSYGEFTSWEEAIEASTGYDQPSILAKTREAVMKVKHGEAVYERDSVIFDHVEYSLPVLAGLMLAAGQNKGRLSVLDFGGSLGSSYYQNRKFLDTLPDVQWGIVEQPHYVACGKEYIQDECLRFYNEIEECAAELKPNVILFGSVLQYLSNPYQIIDQLSRIINTNLLIIDRTPFAEFESDKIGIQKVPSSIYKASYPLWIFSRKCFCEKIADNWQLIEEFDCSQEDLGGKNGFTFQGMIFQRNTKEN
jgi:putative methyltransferase (TIGR04325 family)